MQLFWYTTNAPRIYKQLFRFHTYIFRLRTYMFRRHTYLFRRRTYMSGRHTHVPIDGVGFQGHFVIARPDREVPRQCLRCRRRLRRRVVTLCL